MKLFPAFLGTSPLRRAWLCAGLATALAFLAMFALILVLPLKEFAPYVVTVDKNTGGYEVTKGLEALTTADIVRCLVARESFDATAHQTRYREVGLCMAGQALAAHRRQYDQSNKNSPVVLYGSEGIIRVEIGSVNLLTDTTAIVFFRTILERPAKQSVVNHWRAAVAFGYTNKRFPIRDRFINPFGFQISSYRRDPNPRPTQE